MIEWNDQTVNVSQLSDTVHCFLCVSDDVIVVKLFNDQRISIWHRQTSMSNDPRCRIHEVYIMLRSIYI